MTPDEVVKVLNEMGRTSKEEEVDSWYVFPERIKAILFAISLIQDYQKLRELIDKAQVRLEQARILSVKEPMQLSDRINLNGIIREAITYLQQPTEPIER